jgi:hypothetical protein
MNKFVFILTASFLLASCAFNKDNGAANPQDQRDQENSAKLQGEFVAAQGLYIGTVRAVDREMPIELRLFPQQAESGTSSDGQSRPLPVLKAMLSLTDTLEDDVRLSATFKAATGDLTLSIPQGAGAPANGCSSNSVIKAPLNYSFYGKQNGVYIDGTLTSNEGVVGLVHLELRSKTAGIISTDERSNRYKKLLAPVDGTYVTKIKSITGRNIPIIFAVASSVGLTPTLTVTCRREDTTGQSMQIEFSPNPKPSKITFREAPGTAKADRCFLNNVEGSLNSEGHIDAMVTTIWNKRDKTTLVRCLNPEKIKDCIDQIPEPAAVE